MGSTCARTNSSPQPALGQGQSVCKCCHDLTTSETGLCSCRVQTDPERDGEVPRNVIPERRVRIWQEGHPSPCQEPREEGSVSAAAAQPSFWLRPGTPVASLGKGPLLHPQPCSCCQHQIPLPAPDPSASTCSPATPPGSCHHRVMALPVSPLCRAPEQAQGSSQTSSPARPSRSHSPGTSPAPAATEARKASS